MSTIDIYDVASGNWYRQKTTGGPGQVARGCAVVAPAQDGSSFNIYYYGGYDGLHQSQAFSDDVWVLSLPSFTWVKLASSTVEGRAGHKCVMPYPDQMLVIGGYPSLQGANTVGCLQETIRVFNLSTGKWLDRYDPSVYANYTVPSAVHDKIGGSGTGGATATTPSPSWGATELAGIFAAQYPMTKITTYYPYASVAPTNNTNPNAPVPSVESQGGGLPSYLPPVLGVVLGLVFLTMAAVLILLWRRRRLLQRGGGTMSEAGTEDTNGNRITSWLRGQTSEPKTLTTATASDYSPVASTTDDDVFVPPQSIAEMMNTEVQLPAELPGTHTPPFFFSHSAAQANPSPVDTSPPAELHSTTLTPSSSPTPASLNNTTLYSTTHQTDHANPTSPPGAGRAFLPTPPPIPQDESPVFYRPDSDALGREPPTSATSTNASPIASTTTTRGAVLSGISNISERDRAHLRQISDTTVSSIGGYGDGDRRGERVSALSTNGTPAGLVPPGVTDRGLVESPAAVSPPTATQEGFAGDYLNARLLGGQGSPASPLRRSVFSEDINGDDVGLGGSGSGSGSGTAGRR